MVWMDPFTEERLLMRVDEGIIDRASGVPARQYRYHFVDETLWTHPASEIRILSTTPETGSISYRFRILLNDS